MKALISVSDKTGLVDFAKALVKLGYELVSTTSTHKHLQDSGIATQAISDLTNADEILDGRVKTLHPHIYAGILYQRDNNSHQQTIKALAIDSIDIVCVNLYPFEQMATKGGDDLIEYIDIGGVALLRAAAKNYQDCLVVCDHSDYAPIIDHLNSATKGTQKDAVLRSHLMQKAFCYTAHYDITIANHYMQENNGDALPKHYLLSAKPFWSLKYGENPHQQGRLYQTSDFLEHWHIIKGEISFNNILDIQAALRLCTPFQDRSHVAIIKHNNPCGFAIDESIIDAFHKALICDQTSAYGGVIAINAPVDEKLALTMSGLFFEVIVAPSFTKEAIDIFSNKKRVKIIQMKHHSNHLPKFRSRYDIRSIEGGILVQESDQITSTQITNAQLKSERSANETLFNDLSIAYKIVACTKSNGIAYVKNSTLVAIGMGMTSRIDAVKSAVAKAFEQQVDVRGSAMASEAFLPFRDSIDEAGRCGIQAIIQPGGSIRDDEIIAAANEHQIALYFSGYRHFLH